MYESNYFLISNAEFIWNTSREMGVGSASRKAIITGLDSADIFCKKCNEGWSVGGVFDDRLRPSIPSIHLSCKKCEVDEAVDWKDLIDR